MALPDDPACKKLAKDPTQSMEFRNTLSRAPLFLHESLNDCDDYMARGHPDYTGCIRSTSQESP